MKHTEIIILWSLCGIYSLYSMEFGRTSSSDNLARPSQTGNAARRSSSSSSSEEEVEVREQREVPPPTSTATAAATAALQAIWQVNQAERDLKALQTALVGKTLTIGTTTISFKGLLYNVVNARGTCSAPGSLTLRLDQDSAQKYRKKLHEIAPDVNPPLLATSMHIKCTWQTTRGDSMKSPCAQQGAHCVKVMAVTSFEKKYD